MASSSSSHQQNQQFNAFSVVENIAKRRKVSESSRLYDAFINHRGPDVKQTLATQLYNSLQQLGIRAFLDSEEKELGNSFPSTIEVAICSAKVHIAIFSPRYAESPWCLAELVLMSESKAKIIPVFYKVKPSDIRHIEKGMYANAFIEHKEKGRYTEEKLKEWKEVLHSLSFIAGLEFKSDMDCQIIVAAVINEVHKQIFLHVAEYPVGLNNLVKQFERRCLKDQCGLRERDHKNKVVGIFGIGGSGKTTLAKELCNQKRENYKKASFLFNVREKSVTGQLHCLQHKLSKDLFDDRDTCFTSAEEGTSYLKDRLRRSPHSSFLIVVDDVDHVEQLNALLVIDFLNKSGDSLVIVTTRDVGVLKAAGITVDYNLKGMDLNSGRELFSWHAFRQASPYSGYGALVDSFVDVCQGLPLALQVLGRHVHGRDHRFWESELMKAKKTLPPDIMQRLKISFDALDGEEKQVFMDIACFFVSRQTSLVERILEGSGWNAHNAMERLKDKCFIEIGQGSVLRMHDHLRDLGRELAVQLSPPRRLWRPQDLQSLESMGFKVILTKNNIRCFYSFLDESLGSRVEFFISQPDAWIETSVSLLWLALEGNLREQPSIPTWIPLQNLQFLKINGARLKTLWDSHTQAPSQLKELQICGGSGSSECSTVEDLRLEHLSLLEKLTVQNCSHLKSVSGISCLTSLVELEIHNCTKLGFESLTLRAMKSLERTTFGGVVDLKYLRLDSCPKLKALLGLGYDDIVELSIRDCPELEWVPAFSSRSCLETIIIDDCGKLKYFQLCGCTKLRNVSLNSELRDLTITQCSELQGFPCFGRLNCLERIRIDSCEKLQNIILPATIMCVSVHNCRNLQRVAGIGDLPKLTKLAIKVCPALEQLSFPPRLSILKAIVIDYCEKLQNIARAEELCALQGLQYMRLCYCSNALIRNCVRKMKSMPPYFTILIGRAADAAESILNDLFCHDKLGTPETCKKRSEFGAIIGCCLVVVDDSFSPSQAIRSFFPCQSLEDFNKLHKGKWIVTVLSFNPLFSRQEVERKVKLCGNVKKGIWAEMKKGHVGKSVDLLNKIVNTLYYL